MSRPLPADREKALAAIANGWGREATAAHPDCRCSNYSPPSYLPPCNRCGANRGEKCRQPGPVCGKTSIGRYQRRLRDHRLEHGCRVHGETR